ncbi:MAG TPA: cytochrome c oxidase subunit II, partial [Burkholderiaceae bacterium]|nr:cytochrome c oxidase subunit II [Burkholderiaceae bacterium]
NLFLAWVLVRYRHRAGHRAAYQADNRRLERWLIVGTTVGIAALLAPGLVVYAEYVTAPGDALVLEVLGQQWKWSYRLPGADARFGGVDPRFVSATNPFGLDPGDPAGADDLLVPGDEVHVPLGRPVKVLLRSNDVLHDFYVPPFRARMNIVPGTVTSFWFTPTQTGRFEVLCAQLCGVGHYNMRGFVVVEPAAAFAGWVAHQTSFAQALNAAASVDPLVARGRALAQSKGCVACHTVDGSKGVGPTWQGLLGKTEHFTDGSSARLDADALRQDIREPLARIAQGYAAVMPRPELSDAELDALVAYIGAQSPK